jgi:predicted TIM-barrel fold metal-dependent hydrolase
MRIVALEEHFTVPALAGRIDLDAITRRGFPPPGTVWSLTIKQPQLQDLGPARMADMDAAGITVQVLSLSGAGADLVPGPKGVSLAREFNDTLKGAIDENPQRMAGFAHLPMLSPEAAADELERCVTQLGFNGALINGLIDGRFLDDLRFDPILARAEHLDVPIYLHPWIPPASVREAYYAGLPEPLGFMLSVAGWGWHMETAIHVLRLVLSGTLERHPRLKLIVGHMGESLPFMLARSEAILGGEFRKISRRSLAETILQQVWITTSGFFTVPPLMAALATFGADRILFSVDYPFSANAAGRRFLDDLPVSPEDKAKIAHGNADRLLKLPV